MFNDRLDPAAPLIGLLVRELDAVILLRLGGTGVDGGAVLACVDFAQRCNTLCSSPLAPVFRLRRRESFRKESAELIGNS